MAHQYSKQNRMKLTEDKHMAHQYSKQPEGN